MSISIVENRDCLEAMKEFPEDGYLRGNRLFERSEDLSQNVECLQKR